MIKVLVIEDDTGIAAAMVRGLREEGFFAEAAGTVAYGVERLLAESFDVAILDLGLPDGSGFDVLASAQARCSTPVIVLTARERLDDRVAAFTAGAVDYMTKPFFMEELVLRIRARLNERPPAIVHQIGDVTCDFEGFEFRRDGEEIPLTRVEAQVLRYLVERPNRAISRGQIAQHALSIDGDANDRTVDAHVAKVRKKLGDAGAAIVTVWGIGYRFQTR